MGSAVADALARGGARVMATIGGRSARTAGLAERARLELLSNLGAVVASADVVLSIVPPEAAESVAEDLASAARAASVRPLVVDLNAIAPETSRRHAGVVARAGCDYVDGSISGPPPWNAGTTRIYLSGDRALEVAELPMAGVERIVVGPDGGSASAVKMSTASVYKGTTALLAQALLAAHANGVLEHVLADLRAAAPELVASIERRLALATTKAPRYAGEMREIAETQQAAGLTPALFEGIAEVFERLARSPLASASPEDIATPDLDD